MSTPPLSTRASRLVKGLKEYLAKPTIVVESAEGARFPEDDYQWNDEAQKDLQGLFRKTLRPLLEESAHAAQPARPEDDGPEQPTEERSADTDGR